MEINVLRGRDQIGGNIIEIKTGTTKILLDIGLELDDGKNYVLPDVPGLFGYKGYDAVFISHYHGDHLGLAYKAHPGIPLYIGEASYKIIKASDDYKGVESIKPAGFLKTRNPIRIGDINVTPYLCDHSAFDSYMLLCESGGQRVLYSGDFRANGRKSFDLFLKSVPRDVDILICEGTTLSRDNYVPENESSLEEKAVRLLREHQGPFFVLQSSMNIDRIVTMYRAAKRTGRVFLEELYMADITSAIGGSIPNPKFSDVMAFITNPKRYDGLCRYSNKVGKEYISHHDFVMCVRTSMLPYLVALSREMSFHDGILIYSFWNGYRETLEMQEFLKACEALGLTVHTLHTSGHADAATIKKFIETVNPKRLIPVHTENAKWFKENYSELL